MNDVFQDLSIKQDLFKVRIFFLCAAICSPIFYFFMKHIQIGSIDSLFMRIFIFVLSLIGLMVTYLPRLNTKLNFFLYSIVRLSYLALYLYMLSVNHWTMYQRWAYFVLASILCGSALRWKEYLFVSFFSVLAPLILGLLSSIPAIEQIHFLAANLATFVIIGLSVSSHYHFKSEVVNLTNSLIEKSQMAVLGEIAASISHEMNTPLMIFTNSLHQISRKMSPEIKAQYFS
jgi:signal transduction histidine kinase